MGGAGSSGAQMGSRSGAFGKGWAWDTGSGLAGTIDGAQGRGSCHSAVDFGGTQATGDRGGLGGTGSGGSTSGAGEHSSGAQSCSGFGQITGTASSIDWAEGRKSQPSGL